MAVEPSLGAQIDDRVHIGFDGYPDVCPGFALVGRVKRIVEAEEAHRIGLLNHVVPSDQLREKTMELATMIAKNHRGSVKGIKELLLRQKGGTLEEQWQVEKDYTTHVMKGAKAEDAFPEFIARKGRPLPSSSS